MGDNIIMKKNKLKKKRFFSLIAFSLCCAILYSANCNLDLVGYINKKFEVIKEKEMKYIFGERNTQSDKYSESSMEYNVRNVIIGPKETLQAEKSLLTDEQKIQRNYSLLEKQTIISDKTIVDYINMHKEYQSFSNELKKQIEEDSYRNTIFDLYYVFNYEYTIDTLKELAPLIEKVAEAQKMPKALLTSVLFREMMFIGQEDLLDGNKLIGGKSMGICQIGVDNVRFNESAVHGDKSIISNKTDEEIMSMLQNPKQAVYFCAVQLRARAINLTGNRDINLFDLNEEQIHKVFEEYNQSEISFTIGPIKTKEKYGQETYEYYKLFSKLYELDEKMN